MGLYLPEKAVQMLPRQTLAHGSRPPRMLSVMQRSWPLHHAVSDPQLQILGLNLLISLSRKSGLSFGCLDMYLPKRWNPVLQDKTSCLLFAWMQVLVHGIIVFSLFTMLRAFSWISGRRRPLYSDGIGDLRAINPKLPRYESEVPLR